MSEVKVNKISPRSGTDVQLGDSGDTITIPAGATFDASNATTTLPANVVTTDGTQTLTNKIIDASQLTDSSVTNAKLANSSISINGSSVSLGGSTTIETGTSWQSSIVTAATLTAEAGKGYWINTTSNACTITLPASASVGDTIEFSDYLRTWGTNSITINQNSLNFQGNTSPNPEYNTDGQSVRIVYSGATQGWIPTVDDDVTLETPQGTDIDFLVVAGGGAGGSMTELPYNTGGGSGGGGAGGYRTSTETAVGAGIVITVTVGDGGASVNDQAGTKGSNSSISGSGITTITSEGGGGGSGQGGGSTGGSGGGGSSRSTSGNAGNSPSTSPAQGFAGGTGLISGNTYAGGGGGGANQVGTNASSPNHTGGNGGDGTASSITGSSVFYAGGGGGGSRNSTGGASVAGQGGAGGGGNGAKELTPNQSATDGTVNLGGGGGGGHAYVSDDRGGEGGKGVVILSMPDANYTGTTTGSPTVATGVSGKTVLTFTGSGSYTT